MADVIDAEKWICCVCSAATKVFKFGGRKDKEEGFSDKFKLILDNSSVFQVLSKSAAVCRSCYKKVTDFREFQLKLQSSCGSFVSKITQKRRLDEYAERPPAKSIKYEVSKEDNVENIGPGGDAADDHTYVKGENAANFSVPYDVSLLGQFFKECQTAEKRPVLNQLWCQASSLTTRSDETASVLYKYRNIENLSEKVDHLLIDLVNEMAERVPLLLEVMCCVAVPVTGKLTKSLIPVLATAYSVLLKHKFHNLSAFHRLTTTIVTRGGLDERLFIITFMCRRNRERLFTTAQTRLNHLGLTLSSERRTRLPDSAEESSRKLIRDNLARNPLIKITGDNLDIYIKTSNMSAEKRNRDLHLFTSNVIFSRCAETDMDNSVPNTDLTKLSSKTFFLLTMNNRERI